MKSAQRQRVDTTLRRRQAYMQAYAERFGRLPKRLPEFVETPEVDE